MQMQSSWQAFDVRTESERVLGEVTKRIVAAYEMSPVADRPPVSLFVERTTSGVRAYLTPDAAELVRDIVPDMEASCAPANHARLRLVCGDSRAWIEIVRP